MVVPIVPFSKQLKISATQTGRMSSKKPNLANAPRNAYALGNLVSLVVDHYSQFSEVINNINLEEKKWLEEELASWDQRSIAKDEKEQAQRVKQFGEERGIEGDQVDTWPNFEWEIRPDSENPANSGLWIYSDSYFSVDCISAAIQRFLQRFRPNYIFKMNWAETCSKPRIGAFGGGWMVVTAHDIKTGNTWHACDAAANKLEKKMEKKCQKKTKRTKKK